MTRLPTEVRVFVEKRFGSFQELETLLLLRRYSDRSWSVESVSDRLKVSEPEAAACLAHVLSLELIEVEERVSAETRRFRYAPRTTELAHLASAVALACEEQEASVRRTLRESRRPVRTRPRPEPRASRFLLH